MRPSTTARGLAEGLIAAVAALLAMAGTAAVGLALLGAGRTGDFDALTAAVVAMAAGGPAAFSVVPAGEFPIAVQGRLDLMPMGVSLAGALVLWWLLRRGGDRLLARSAAALAAFTAGIAGATLLAKGTVSLEPPDGGTAPSGVLGCTPNAMSEPGERAASGGSIAAEFSVAMWPAVGYAALSMLAVIGACFLAARFRAASAGIRAVLWGLGGVIAVGLLATWVSGGAAAAGGLLLIAPVVVFGSLLRGLGVPWTVFSDGLVACDADVAPLASNGLLTVVSGAALLACGIAVAASAEASSGGPLRRAATLAVGFAAATGAGCAAAALLSGISIELGVEAFGFSRTLMEAELASDPLHAFGAGLAGGLVAGFAGSLIVEGFRNRTSLSWSMWSNRRRR